MNLSITAGLAQGSRHPWNEDCIKIAVGSYVTRRHWRLPPTGSSSLVKSSFSYFALFDGHGGRDAGLFAKAHLHRNIIKRKSFWKDNDSSVLSAISQGFQSTNAAMFKAYPTWNRPHSGTTATVGFLLHGKLYWGHVGDSRLILGVKDKHTGGWKAHTLTQDHKPDVPEERRRIVAAGGKILRRESERSWRIVMTRPIPPTPPSTMTLRSAQMEDVPKLNMSRALGDFWSWNPWTGHCLVSPKPDVGVVDLNFDDEAQYCLIFGSDGLWDGIEAGDALNFVWEAIEEQKEGQGSFPGHSNKVRDIGSFRYNNPASRILRYVLRSALREGRWRRDDASVISVVISPSQGQESLNNTGPTLISDWDRVYKDSYKTEAGQRQGPRWVRVQHEVELRGEGFSVRTETSQLSQPRR